MDPMTDENEGVARGADVVEELKASGALDALFDKIDAGEVELTGEGGLIPGLIKAVLERGLQAELTDHLGYEKGDPGAALRPNSRNGTTPKTVAARSATLRWTSRGTGRARSPRGWCRRAHAGSAVSTR